MYAFHRILADYSPLVEFYVLDAKPLPSGRGNVRLTVLVHPFTSQALIRRMWVALSTAMPQDELADICDDFDIVTAKDRVVSWSPIVQRSAVPL